MGAISDKLMRIINTKEDIRQALISKGYDVPTSIPFKEYAKMISDLPCRVYSFPDIEGIVARYSALGLTNEQMAENPVWKDLTDNGHDLQMKNLAWKGMSGVGGYVGDFSKWVNNRDTTEIGITKSNSKVIIDVKVSQGSGKNIVFISKSNLGISNNVTIKITSTYPEGVMKFANSASNKYLKLPSNGIITLQDNPEYTRNEMHLHLASADLGQITIEQLPLYPGALVFDGVDDYGVCKNFPILTKEKGYTVVALRQWITRGEGALGLVSNVENWLNNGAFLLEYRNIQADHLNKPISFGAIGSEMDLPHILTYQTSKSCNGVSITTGNFEGTDVLHVGKLAPTNVGTCINAAIWELVFLDHDATEEELTKIKDYFVKTYPRLFPDQAWTVTGKTNEDEDRATIANITGNGNDLVLSNFGFAEGSGYGLYAEKLVRTKDQIIEKNKILEANDPEKATAMYMRAMINTPAMLENTDQSLALKIKGLYPIWDKDGVYGDKGLPMGTAVVKGQRFRSKNQPSDLDWTLFEVRQNHNLQADWVPGQGGGAESLYMVVQEKHSGTVDDPIPWVYNSILENGKYYIDKEIKYLCIRNSGIPLAYENLSDLVSAGYVRVV